MASYRRCHHHRMKALLCLQPPLTGGRLPATGAGGAAGDGAAFEGRHQWSLSVSPAVAVLGYVAPARQAWLQTRSLLRHGRSARACHSCATRPCLDGGLLPAPSSLLVHTSRDDHYQSQESGSRTNHEPTPPNRALMRIRRQSSSAPARISRLIDWLDGWMDWWIDCAQI